jgi:hypothetical protein
MVDVVVDQSLLGLSDCLLDGVDLLRDVEARAPILDHGDYGAEVTLGPLEALHDVRVGLV